MATIKKTTETYWWRQQKRKAPTHGGKKFSPATIEYNVKVQIKQNTKTKPEKPYDLMILLLDL